VQIEEKKNFLSSFNIVSQQFISSLYLFIVQPFKQLTHSQVYKSEIEFWDAKLKSALQLYFLTQKKGQNGKNAP